MMNLLVSAIAVMVCLVGAACQDRRVHERSPVVAQDRPAHPRIPTPEGPTTTQEPVGSGGATITPLDTDQPTEGDNA
jgi:hypothetical protein